MTTFERAAPGFIIVDHTRGSPQMVAKLDRMVRAAGGRYAEAPMTRTPKHADIGKVNVLFGGQRDLLDDLRPYFELYAENIFHIARVGPKDQQQEEGNDRRHI